MRCELVISQNQTMIFLRGWFKSGSYFTSNLYLFFHLLVSSLMWWIGNEERVTTNKKMQKIELFWTLSSVRHNTQKHVNSGSSTMSQSDSSSQSIPKTVHPTAKIITSRMEMWNACRWLTHPFHREEEGFIYVLNLTDTPYSIRKTKPGRLEQLGWHL